MKKILCIHGIGGKERFPQEWQPLWSTEISKKLGIPESNLTFKFLEIDGLFEEYKEEGIQYRQAFFTLLNSWISTAVEELSRGKGLRESIRWTAGMVAQFVTNKKLRKALNDKMDAAINDFDPDFVYAHSLGTLVAYDYLAQQSSNGNTFRFSLMTTGAQIAHMAMRKTFGGSIVMLNVKRWINLYNQYDKVFTTQIRIHHDNFFEFCTPFEESFINHDAMCYINHENAVHQAWPIISNLKDAEISRILKRGIVAKKKSTQKVLLVGINDYPNPEDQLNGCVNDVYRMSEVLQEMGIDPDNIRVVLNNRATANNIRSRMEWLLEDAKDGDFRFFLL